MQALTAEELLKISMKVNQLQSIQAAVIHTLLFYADEKLYTNQMGRVMDTSVAERHKILQDGGEMARETLKKILREADE